VVQLLDGRAAHVFPLSFGGSSIFFVPAQLWRHDRSTEYALEGKHWAACSCTNMILIFLLSAAALHGPHTAHPGGSAVAQLLDGRAAHVFALNYGGLSIFFVPAQLWRHDRSTECPLEGKHMI